MKAIELVMFYNPDIQRKDAEKLVNQLIALRKPYYNGYGSDDLSTIVILDTGYKVGFNRGD